MALTAIKWTGQTLELLDQRALPHEQRWLVIMMRPVAPCNKRWWWFSAPAIGIAAAWGVVLATMNHEGDRTSIKADIECLIVAANRGEFVGHWKK